MKVRLLKTEGDGKFIETDYELGFCEPDGIQVRALMTGICRSDIAMMNGEFGPLPDGMSGHEGLGQVVAVGMETDLRLVRPGDIVATRGEPAYADFYNVRRGEFVVVPEADQKYILEPVACGINVAMQALKTPRICRSVLILGSGFLAQTAYFTLKQQLPTDIVVDVVGHHNQDRWTNKYGVTLHNEIPDKYYDIVIDLSTDDAVFRKKVLNDNGLLVLAAEKNPAVSTTFAQMLWGANSICCPSPRNSEFYSAMTHAASWIKSGKLDTTGFWTRGYDRNTEWKQAFADGNNRPPGYSRGYLVWPK